jgi:transposase InsO family protein
VCKFCAPPKECSRQASEKTVGFEPEAERHLQSDDGQKRCDRDPLRDSLRTAQVIIENWRRHYNTVRPHSSLDYRPPAPEVLVWPAAQPGPAPAAAPALALRPIMN